MLDLASGGVQITARWVIRAGEAFLVSKSGLVLAKTEGDLSAAALRAAANDASSLIYARALNAQLTGKEIASGHAFEKHVLGVNNANGQEFAALGIKTRDQFAEFIEKIVASSGSVKNLDKGRTAFWDELTSTIVIKNPSAKDGGTAFRPTNGRKYFEALKEVIK